MNTAIKTAATPEKRAEPTVSPRVDIYESDDEFLVLSDLPGVSADSVLIRYERDRLQLQASRADGALAGKRLAGDGKWYDFARTFRLEGIDGDKISAEFNDGVLRLHLPKAAAIKPREIPITAG